MAGGSFCPVSTAATEARRCSLEANEAEYGKRRENERRSASQIQMERWSVVVEANIDSDCLLLPSAA